MKNTYTIHPTLPDVYVVDISTRGHPGKEMLVCSIGIERLDASVRRRWFFTPGRGGANPRGYAWGSRTVDGRPTLVQAHRIVAEAPLRLHVVHRDADSLNNCLSNLQLASPRAIHAATGVKSATAPIQRRWQALILVGGRNHYLGTYDSYEECHERKRQAHELCLAAEIAGTPFDDRGFRAAFGLEPVRPYVRV